jgi:hypothetical protein
MGTGNAKQPPRMRAAGEVLPHRPAPTGQAPGGAGQGAGLPPARAGRRNGKFGLSPVSVSIIALAVVGVMVGAVVHLALVFLSVAPLSPLSQQHAAGIYTYIAPELTQDWKLFAPNPTSINYHVQARAKVLRPDGTVATTSWVDLSAVDEAQILHNPFPSQTKQNELRIAWTDFVYWHDDQGRPIGTLGKLTQEYLVRIVAHRFGPHFNGGTVQLIQVRSANIPVGAPPWSNQHIDSTTSYQVEPWWSVDSEDFK